MSEHPFPISESQRLAAVKQTGLLDTPPEPPFDAYARIASAVTRAPLAFVSLVDRDRQFYKARVGTTVAESPRHGSFCDEAIRGDGLFEVPDLARDVRFADHPSVSGPPHARFYAGVPLVLSTGEALGTLCVLDICPKELTGQERAGLEDLARLVVREIETTRIATAARHNAQRLTEERDSAREAAEASRLVAREMNHRMGNLFAQVSGLVSLAGREHGGGANFVADVRQRVMALKSVSDLLVHEGWKGARLTDIAEAALAPVTAGEGAHRIEWSGPALMLTDRAALNVALLIGELGANAIRHGALTVPDGRVCLSWFTSGDTFHLDWAEEGVSAISPPSRRGFGSVLLTRVAPASLTGQADLSYQPPGFRYHLSAAADFVLHQGDATTGGSFSAALR